MATFSAINKVDESVAGNWERRRSPRASRHFEAEVLDPLSFIRVLRLEHKRAERSNNKFVLMVLDASERFHAAGGSRVLASIVSAISNSTRETDTLGWHEEGRKLGIVFTDIAATDNTAISKIVERITRGLQQAVSSEEFRNLKLTFAAFPASPASESLPPKSDLVPRPDTPERSTNASLQLRHAT